MRKSKLFLVDDWAELAERAGFDPAVLARNVGVSLRQFERFCRVRWHLSPRAWLNGLRLSCAAERLLREQQIKVLATELGFSSVSHFCRRFKAEFGCTPSEFRAAQVEAANAARRRSPGARQPEPPP